MQRLPANVWFLLAAQALNQSCAPMLVLVGGLIGSQLAPSPGLATLPVALMVVGSALATIPVVMLSQRWGRKRVFYVGMVLSATGSLLCSFALVQQWFVGFCGGTLLMGSSLAVVQQYRFAAMESVPPNLVPKAASSLLLAGLVAAFLGPELAVWGRDIMVAPYAASLISLSVLNIIAGVVLMGYQGRPVASHQRGVDSRPWREILNQPVLWVAIGGALVGYTVMSFVMTATPISMHMHSGHDLVETKRVIQSHIVAMYLPSLFSGWLIAHYGTAKIMLAGCVALLGALVVASSGIALNQYWLALVLLGIGWNFLFVSGTALLPQAYGDGEPFRVQALNEFLVFGSQAIASLSAGWVLASLGWSQLIYVCAPLIFAHLLLLLYWSRSATSSLQRLE
jgi:MFS family permease